MSGSAMFEWSTPAEAQTKPCRVSAMTRPPSEADDRAPSRARITSSWREVGLRAGELARPLGGLDLREGDDTALGLRDGLLGDDDDVAVAQRDGARDERREVGARRDLGQPLDRQDLDHAFGMPVTRDAGVGAVAAVQVDDHRGQALERAGARRAGPRRARDPRRALPASASASSFATGSSPQTSASSSGRGRDEVGAPRSSGARRRRARRRRAWIRSASEVRSGSGRTPSAANTSSLATESSGVEPSAPPISRAVSSAASALTASTARSTPWTASSFDRALDTGPELGRRRPRPGRVARADHDLVLPERDKPAGERPTEAAGPAEDRDPHATVAAASSTAWARRRRARSSTISVRAITARTPPGSSAPASASSITSASIRPA